MKFLLFAVCALMLLTGCTGSAKIENPTDLEYPSYDLEFVQEDQALECCSAFLDLYEEDLLNFYHLFSKADLPVENFYMMTDQRDTGDDVSYLIGEDMQKGNLEDYPLAEEIQAFCETFGCTDIEWTPNWGASQEIDSEYFAVKIPVAELQGNKYYCEKLIYCPTFTSHDIVHAVPGHEEWFVDFFEGV